MFYNNCLSDRLILIKIFHRWHTNLLPEFHKKCPLKGHRVTGYWLLKFLVSGHLQKQHKIISCVYQISGTYTFSQKFSNLDATIQTFFSLGQARFWCFPFVHYVLTDSCLMFTEFSSTSNWKQTSQSPASKCSTLLLSKFLFPYYFFFYFWLGETKDIFRYCFFSPREKNREGNHLWQWIIEIFITVRPYKLCTKRATKE